MSAAARTGAASAAGTALELNLQKRVETRPGAPEFRITMTPEKWAPQQTAIIVCDMWDLHHCKNAVLRDVCDIRHTADAVANEDKPSVALRAGRKSSMRLAIDAVAGLLAAHLVQRAQLRLHMQRGLSRAQALTLLLASPEFMRR